MTSVKHAFVLAFYFLLRSIRHNDLSVFYEKALKETLQLGGDTDGNACVVAGLIGSLVGIRRVPIDMLSTLCIFDDKHMGQNRDGMYCVDENLLKTVDKLIEVRPKQKLVILRQES